MRLTRIYQQQILKRGQIISLTKEAACHLVRVLRLRIGDELILFNGGGGEFRAKIISLHKNTVSVQLGDYDPIHRESPLSVTLAQAVLRSEKMDYILQKAIELGVARFIPLLTARGSVKLAPAHWEKRMCHWQGIIIAACEQSGRTRLPYLERPHTVQASLTKIKDDPSIFLLPQAIQTIHQLPMQAQTELTLFVGPEGGWSEQEVKLATDARSIPIQLGPRILRAETAGLVAISLLQSLFGDI